MLYKYTVLYVEVLPTYANGVPLPEDRRGTPTPGWLWILPGCLVSGRGPVYRSLDAYLTATPDRPNPDKRAPGRRLGDTRTRIDRGVLMVYGSEIVTTGGGGYMPKPQVWACRPLASPAETGPR